MPCYWQLTTNFQWEEVVSLGCLLALGTKLFYDSSYQRGTQVCLSSTGASVWSQDFTGFTSQQKIGQHKFQGYYPPANSPTSRSAHLCVLECFAVRATNKSKKLIPAQSPEWWRLVLRQGTFPSRGALLEISFQLFVTRPSLCLQFWVCRGSNPARVKLMDCDRLSSRLLL